jgi:hypothetical protein
MDKQRQIKGRGTGPLNPTEVSSAGGVGLAVVAEGATFTGSLIVCTPMIKSSNQNMYP